MATVTMDTQLHGGWYAFSLHVSPPQRLQWRSLKLNCSEQGAERWTDYTQSPCYCYEQTILVRTSNGTTFTFVHSPAGKGKKPTNVAECTSPTAQKRTPQALPAPPVSPTSRPKTQSSPVGEVVEPQTPSSSAYGAQKTPTVSTGATREYEPDTPVSDPACLPALVPRDNRHSNIQLFVDTTSYECHQIRAPTQALYANRYAAVEWRITFTECEDSACWSFQLGNLAQVPRASLDGTAKEVKQTRSLFGFGDLSFAPLELTVSSGPHTLSVAHHAALFGAGITFQRNQSGYVDLTTTALEEAYHVSAVLVAMKSTRLFSPYSCNPTPLSKSLDSIRSTLVDWAKTAPPETLFQLLSREERTVVGPEETAKAGRRSKPVSSTTTVERPYSRPALVHVMFDPKCGSLERNLAAFNGFLTELAQLSGLELRTSAPAPGASILYFIQVPTGRLEGCLDVEGLTELRRSGQVHCIVLGYGEGFAVSHSSFQEKIGAFTLLRYDGLQQLVAKDKDACASLAHCFV